MAKHQAIFMVFVTDRKTAGEAVINRLREKQLPLARPPRLLFRERDRRYQVEVAIGVELAGKVYLRTLLAIDAVVLDALKDAAEIRRRKPVAA